ncbi:MAG TPA: (Fe-S)-binding protein [Vicinamibacterales bacterium]|jgi:glycolate dehydrogenase iron-sulfur subunit|nr:(Fe-S)-binding protein [Vicinamibacterales bacterium]
MAGGTLRTIDYAVLQQCMHCGMCLPTCPTYDQTRHERNSPRGRIALMRAVADGVLDVSHEFAEEMSYCLGCLACQTACPAGVNYAELFETARSDIERQGAHRGVARKFWRALTLGFLFMHPGALRLAGRVLGVYQRSGLEGLSRRMGILRLLPASLRRLEPQAPRMAPKFSNALIPPHQAPSGAARSRVALLTGCVQDLVFPDVNRDTADVLLANGCSVDTPPVQPCCGSLHAHNGDLDHARVLARRMIDLFPPERYDAIITNAGGCGSHLRRYAPLLRDDAAYRERAVVWDRKIRDIQEWLIEIGCRPPQASPFSATTTVTYHESCHLVHGQKVSREPRAVLRLLPAVSLVELPESTWCCGSAGVYAITQPEQAERLLGRKTANIVGTGAEWVATANPGCHLQIARGLDAAGARIQVTHPVSLLARAYRREGQTGSDPGLTPV